ncbi:zinc finger A20 and AN1 domain-containing stress-associated protein 4-like [Aristolochia californica]|uniref:zinc finger A20 and AN1 domain-containing stress-associated protein 4-like n=1 Tax=Aristolochia californica TaxID=171875 RepID=UPI0035DC9B50
MAEEHRCQAQEGHCLCANNCGFFGNPATLNLCSKCYRDFRLKEEQASSAKSAVENSLNGVSPSPAPPSADGVRNPVSLICSPSSSAPETTQPPSAVPANRCSTCQKRVGLTGFQCRCGPTFCKLHRYPEQHGCTFDYKAAAREAIAKANPVVIAEKLEKV